MSGEPKDPAIKLFGKTIPLPEIPPEAAPVDSNLTHETGPPPEEDCVRADKEEKEDSKETSKGNPTTSTQEDETLRPIGEDSTDPDAASGISENNKTTSVDKESATQKPSKSDEEQSETSNTQEKPLKKPDKILPCPRCNSMDTKFCYYNNYNVNQPRHFCKNCQRYWTAGGTMRNVPVGAGRRKNKSSASHYHRHITVSEALQNVVPNGVHPVKPNGTVLAFGSSDTPLCESMASVLNLADKTMRVNPRNGFHKPDGVIMPGACSENRLDPLNGSSAMGPNSKDAEGKDGTVPGFVTQIPCYPGAPWPYPWNSGQWGPTLPPPPPYCPPGFAVPFFPAAAAYWGCSVPGAWNFPWVPGPSSPVTNSTGSGPNSPTLGKHSRDEQNVLKQSGGGGEDDEPTKEASAEKCLWIPKTLRIDDPGEAAKSSIWATLGIKNDKAEPVSGGGLFKAFQSKSEERNHSSEASPLLQANPAALSRSVNFHESS
ncbi:hypothetical protein CDL15_Pgr020539 [Punica granatum]|uniref:Dof-type domain-containing protein n=1 Tax=Punica granatum TaxID=22663 RepID=A0A218VXH7_PUNGR|nr:hypothetical protein CDL15_Pgr020539 [Punica granatum]